LIPNGAAQVYVIVGDPVAQTQSPMLFNEKFRRLERNALLIPARVPTERLGLFFAGARTIENLRGIVVTVPHKIAALEYVDGLEETARRIGSINAIRCGANGEWAGANFDGEGCLAGFRQAGFAVEDKRILLVGAGGAGRAVAHALAATGVAELRIFDLVSDRAKAVCESVRKYYSRTNATMGSPDPATFDVVLNCTALGMKRDDPLPIDAARLREGTFVFDLVQSADPTPLLREALKRGCRIQLGQVVIEQQVNLLLDFFDGDLQ
jgi:shikimate dehydrogenase